MSTADDIVGIFEQYECGIGYTSTQVEVDTVRLFPSLSPKIVYTIQPIASLIPTEESQRSEEIIGNRSAFILIPGTRFDARGTRHGKGAGWYDRFLSVAPKNWLRVGVCYEEQFSHEALARESWDETMDFVLVVSKETNAITSHETHARDNADIL